VKSSRVKRDSEEVRAGSERVRMLGKGGQLRVKNMERVSQYEPEEGGCGQHCHRAVLRQTFDVGTNLSRLHN